MGYFLGTLAVEDAGSVEASCKEYTQIPGVFCEYVKAEYQKYHGCTRSPAIRTQKTASEFNNEFVLNADGSEPLQERLG